MGKIGVMFILKEREWKGRIRLNLRRKCWRRSKTYEKSLLKILMLLGLVGNYAKDKNGEYYRGEKIREDRGIK